MQEDGTLQQCLRLVARLNDENLWALSPEAVITYATRITAISSDADPLSDERLCLRISNYHRDHALVEALCDGNHPNHATVWMEWTQQTLRFLFIKVIGELPDTAVSLDDLTQDSLNDLWLGLPRFRYDSRFQTWAYTIISNRVSRYFRDTTAGKRVRLSSNVSLDKILEDSGDTFIDVHTPSLDEIVLNKELDALLEEIFAQHPDERLKRIFDLWLHQEQTLRAIGEHMHLSASRVYVLLKQALDYLHNNASLRDWVDNEEPPNEEEVR